MEYQLIEIQDKKILTEPGSLSGLLSEFEGRVLAVAYTADTAKGRKEIASAAHRVSKAKSYIDQTGKEINDELKKLPKIVDENRREARQRLDALREKVRLPLTQWEEEQARIEQEEQAKIKAEELEKEVAACYELADLMNSEFDRKIEEKKEEEERLKKEHEERIAKEAAEAEKRRAQEEIEAAKRAEMEAKIALEMAEKAKIKAAQDAEKQAKEAAEMAVRIEKERAEAAAKKIAEEEAKAQAEKEKAEKSRAHKAKIHKEILGLLIGSGLDEAQSKMVITMAAKGRAGRLTIDYSL